ncbi:MAG TPA: peptide chain release factor N(5)-glutamine methyltransferase [bacterium]|nr:peptide chain release factor N(5)-glutamine methyltransferase [bacterium]
MKRTSARSGRRPARAPKAEAVRGRPATFPRPPRAAGLLQWGAGRLARAGIESPRRNAELLLAALLGCDRSGLYLEPERVVSRARAGRFREQIGRRGRGEPLQYLTGRVNFFRDSFRVRPGVFIPRPETELLVTQGLALLEAGRDGPATVLEVGAGSGAPGLSLARHGRCRVWLLEKEARAVGLARLNRRRLGLDGRRVRILAGDWNDFHRRVRRRFQLVVSNPPYVPAGQLSHLEREVRREPRTALAAGRAGLDFFRRLAPGAFRILVPGGWLLVEIGFGQAAAVREIFRAAGFQTIGEFEDYNGRPRVIRGRKPFKWMP